MQIHRETTQVYVMDVDKYLEWDEFKKIRYIFLKVRRTITMKINGKNIPQDVKEEVKIIYVEKKSKSLKKSVTNVYNANT